MARVSVVDRVASNDDVFEHVDLGGGNIQHVRKATVTEPGTALNRALFEQIQDMIYNPTYPDRILPCPYQHRVEITSSQNWTVPAGVTTIDVIIVGGGQAGERATSTATRGLGGDGGEVRKLRGLTVTPGSAISVTIGAGGVGSTSAGQAVGGNTQFGAYTAYGGGTANASGDIGSAGGNATEVHGHDNGTRLNADPIPWRVATSYLHDRLLYGYDPYTGILYAGGGGRGETTQTMGGSGGGVGGVNGPGGDATANMGGGGGGGEYESVTVRGGNGGSGIVIIYY